MNQKFTQILDIIEENNIIFMEECMLKYRNIDYFFYKKVLVVPYTLVDSKMKTLMCFSAKHKEWTFICGTIEQGESPIDAAIRELYEETKNIIDVPKHCLEQNLNFEYNNVYKDRMYRCHVFFVDITNFIRSGISFTTEFNRKIMKGYEYNENSYIKFMSHQEVLSKTHIWNIAYDLIKAPVFYDIVEALKS